MKSKLKIIGLTEQIRWRKADSKSGWFAAIGIEGLVPALAAGGYAYNYTIELISADGQIVNPERSHLSQAPDAFGTSTSVAIGGMGLQPGKYTVKVKCEVGEDSFTIDVPDSSIILPEIKKKQDVTIIIKKIINTKNEQLNKVKDIHLQKVGDLTLLTVRRYDDTEYSVIMNDRSMSQVEISDVTIDKVGMFIDKSRNHILRIADEYITKDRKESSFFNDVIILANCLSGLSPESDYLLKVRETTLLHNRIVAQLLNYYTQIGCQVNPKPIVHNKNSRRHDFHVQGLKCEVKTIQTIGEIKSVIQLECALHTIMQKC